MPSPLRYDIAIIGAGPAGSALGILLARQGWSVALLEKEQFPRDKLCGEFLSPECQLLLENLQCEEALQNQNPAHIQQARFSASSGASIVFPLPGIGWGLSRRMLDALLLNQAEQAACRVLQQTKVTALREGDEGVLLYTNREPSTLWAPLVVAAYGRRTSLDRQLRRPFIQQKSAFVGFQRHHYGANGGLPDLSNTVELHTFNQGYCGMCNIEEGMINVCLLVRQTLLSELPKVNWNTLMSHAARQNPLLDERDQQIQPAETTMRTVTQLAFSPKEPAQGRILFLGDAAGMISPLCGDGQAMALESAFLLNELLQEWKEKHALGAQWLNHTWKRRWKKAFAGRMRLGRMLQSLLLNPRWAEHALQLSKISPALPRWLTHATRFSKEKCIEYK